MKKRYGSLRLKVLAVLLLTSILLVNISVVQATGVGGLINTNTTWTLAGSPYIVTSSILVNTGVRLTIEPGVEVKFNAGKSLQVNGELIAQGTSGSPITFTSNVGVNPGDWGYILFNDSSTDAAYDGNGNYTDGSILEYCIVEYGGGGAVAAIRVYASSPLINHSTIRRSGSSGIHIESGKPKISNNTVGNNTLYGIGIDGSSSMADIVGNTIHDNSGDGIGIYGWNVTSGNVANNLVTGNGGNGIQATIGAATGTIQQNISSKNTLWGISVNGDYIVTKNLIFLNKGGGAYVDSLYEMTHNVIADNLGRGYSASVFSPHLRYNTITRNVGDYPVYFAAYSGIRDFIYNTITQNQSTVTNSTVLYLHKGYSGVPLVNNNNIFNNTATYAIRNDYESTVTINVKNNWWDTPLESEIQNKIYDWFDDTFLGVTDYTPWFTVHSTDAPISPPIGVTVSANDNDLVVKWANNPEADVAGYKVYYDTDSGYPYTSVVNVGNVISTTLSGLSSDRHYIAVTAYDITADGINDWTDGNESWFSIEQVTTPLTVTSIDPNRNALNVSPMANVTTTFSADLNASSITSHTFVAHGDLTGRYTQSLSYSAGNRTVTLNPLGQFKPGETIIVSAASGINSTGDTSLTPYVWQFWVAAMGGTGNFIPHPITPSFGGNNSTDVTLGDVDRDGDLDALIANAFNEPETVWLNDGVGNFTSHPLASSFGMGETSEVAMGDVDGDGDLDAVVANYANQVETVWLNDGTGIFTAHPTTPNFGSDSYSLGIALGDMDGDGDLDALVANYDQDETVWLNDSNGNFTPHPTTPNFDAGNKSADVALGDIDGDGDLDALVANRIDEAETVWCNDSLGNFTISPIFSSFGAGSDSFAVALGDVNDDGHLDALVANYGSQAETIWLNDGASKFTASGSFNGGNDSTDVALGDVNGDGALDAIIANAFSETETVWMNNGAGSFTTHPIMPNFGTGDSQGMTLGDIDGDSDLDALVANYNGEAETVWLNGNITSTIQLIYLPVVTAQARKMD